MKVTYLDLATGQTAQDTGISQYELTYGDYSCDCNRAIPFGELNDSGRCDNCIRYIVIGVEAQPMDEAFDAMDVVREANWEYYLTLTRSIA